MPNSPREPQSTDDALAWSVNETKRKLCLGHTRLYELINDGTLKTVKVGKRRLVIAASAKALLQV